MCCFDLLTEALIRADLLRRCAGKYKWILPRSLTWASLLGLGQGSLPFAAVFSFLRGRRVTAARPGFGGDKTQRVWKWRPVISSHNLLGCPFPPQLCFPVQHVPSNPGWVGSLVLEFVFSPLPLTVVLLLRPVNGCFRSETSFSQSWGFLVEPWPCFCLQWHINSVRALNWIQRCLDSSVSIRLTFALPIIDAARTEVKGWIKEFLNF